MSELLPTMDFLLLVITSRYSGLEEDCASDPPRFDLFWYLYFFAQ
jgi:hypothetical protein